LGDIRDRDAIAEVLQTYRIATVYHAAAYKHVPIVERYPFEAIRNNVLGTWSLANAAYEHGVTTFLMISSDKAVNPSSMMGATKRAAEILLSGMPADRTRFVSVRFGNVLGSNGSVIPLFQKQISAGGPVTITHPAMRRYFMTISEAVQLSLNASTMGRRNEVFVLDMGQPVSIVDLAKQMIRLSGLEPDKDIEIRYTGTRPGEKLFEELVVGGEQMAPTDHRKIWVLTGSPAVGSENRIWLTRLKRLLETRDTEGLRAHMRKLIPEFRTPAEEPAVVSIFEDSSKSKIRSLSATAGA
jgi:FlaA1/EpsC-like NDP-sugar epimerase